MRTTFSRRPAVFFRLAALLLPELVLSGCAVLPPRPVPQTPLVTRTASREELLARVSSGGTGIRTMKASFSATFTDPAKRVSRSVSGMLAIGERENLRMKGSAALLPTLFDLLVKDGQASVYVPRDRTVYRSSIGGSPGRGLADAAFLTGVFLGSVEKDGTLHFLEEEPSRYLLYSMESSGSRASLARRIVFDRADLFPVLYQYFDGGGRVVREVRCAGFTPAEGSSVPLPREVSIVAPGEGARLDLRFSDIRVNSLLAPGIFTLETPSGTAVRPIEECAP